VSLRTCILVALLLISVVCNVLQLATNGAWSSPPLPLSDPDISRTRGRSDVWFPQSVSLEGTGFTAHAGPWEYPRTPNFYTVSVEKPYPGGSKVLFEQELRVDELPEGFLKKPIRDIVAFDPTSGTVTFILGERRIEFRLPAEGPTTPSR
jgi:hypothetical protein